MIRNLSILALAAVVVFTMILGGCATSSSPRTLAGPQVRLVNDKLHAI